jgi:hypothetical protein
VVALKEMIPFWRGNLYINHGARSAAVVGCSCNAKRETCALSTSGGLFMGGAYDIESRNIPSANGCVIWRQCRGLSFRSAGT